MTHTTTPPGHTADAEPGDPMPIHPADVLLNLIVILLAPLFIDASRGNIAFARMAALETVLAYRIRHNADLIAVGQVIAFGLAALGSLSLSMADDISVSMALRLRGNANALNRSAEQNRRALKQGYLGNPVQAPANAPQPAQATASQCPTAPRPSAPSPSAQSPAGQSPAGQSPAGQRSIPRAPTQPPEPQAAIQQREYQAMWADAMATVAAELTASLPTLPPDQRDAIADRADALITTANELRAGISGRRPRPGDLRDLMRPTPA